MPQREWSQICKAGGEFEARITASTRFDDPKNPELLSRGISRARE